MYYYSTESICSGGLWNEEAYLLDLINRYVNDNSVRMHGRGLRY